MIIPNAVGRIDEITEAIREGDRERAFELVGLEYQRLSQKREALVRELQRIQNASAEVANFWNVFSRDDDCWIQARRDCGWKGDE